MPQRFSSSAGTPWDPVWSPLGDPWATVGNLAGKICRRPNGDRGISVRSSGTSSRVLERRSTDVYKGKLAGRWPADSRAFICRSPHGDHGWSHRDLSIHLLDPSQQCKSRTLVDELTRRADLKVDTTIAVHVSIDRFLTMGPHKRTKAKNAKAHETSRREEGDTARAGEADEPSTSQEPEDPVDAGVSGDDDTSTRNSISLSQTNRTSWSQPSSPNTQCFTTGPIRTIRTRRREISWPSSLPSPCSQVVSVFFHSNIFFTGYYF